LSGWSSTKYARRFLQLQPISADGGYNARQTEAAAGSVPALSVQIIKQSHDAKDFVLLPQRWVGRHAARRLDIDGDRQGDLVRHAGEHRAALYTRSTHTGTECT
jgi:hypothetical protein